MKKKEFAVGEVFQLGLKKVKVVEKSDKVDCGKCPLWHLCGSDFFFDYSLPIVGHCSKDYRSDGTEVVFVEVEDEE